MIVRVARHVAENQKYIYQIFLAIITFDYEHITIDI